MSPWETFNGVVFDAPRALSRIHPWSHEMEIGEFLYIYIYIYMIFLFFWGSRMSASGILDGIAEYSRLLESVTL